MFLSPSAFANNEKKQSLNDLRGQIEKLNRDLAKSEESRGEVADQLKASESSISEVNRSLTKLGQASVAIGRELNDVESLIRATRIDIAREEALRDQLIRHQYIFGAADATRLVLNGQDVSAVERQLTYLGYVVRSRMATIARLKKNIESLASLEATAKQKQNLLELNAQDQQNARAMLVAERQSRQQVLSRIRSEISKNKREVGKLKRDEDRLAKLVEKIALAIQRAPPRRLAPSAARLNPDKAAATAKREDGTNTATRPQVPNELVLEAADGGFIGRAFASLRGKLKLPVKGELAGRFGAQREEGGVTWKGLFIRAENGQPVRAVADGRVVYADWLRGYGNIVIVDHGAGYLSLYGHNESIVKQVGESANAGEAIASVGSTGGALESGVYFELRQDGKPFDPLRWLNK